MDLGAKAHKQGITLLETPTGYTLVPLQDEKPMNRDVFKKLPERKQKKIQKKIEILSHELKALITQLPEWHKEARERFQELNTEFAKSTVTRFIKRLSDKYSNQKTVIDYLTAVQDDMIANMQYFLADDQDSGLLAGQSTPPPPALRRYEINVLVNNSDAKGAAIIYENNPNYHNLIGRIEHIATEGFLITDFTLIKPGALHRANGGYLILDVHKLLRDPFAWDALKRALYSRKIRMESLERRLGLVSTISLEPEDVPLDIKVILVGDRYFYYLLKAYDQEFDDLFKVVADFSESFDRSTESIQQMALLIAALANKESVLPVSRKGVARIIEHSSRDISDSEKLSLHIGRLKELILESEYWATQAQSKTVEDTHVQQAIDARVHRADHLRERVHEQILRGTVLIDTEGYCVGQVNGLSVFQLGDSTFGQPSRITATARLGKGEVIDIEREIKLGGAIHSKGVMILSSCLANRYAQDRPMSLSATLVFEQSYGGVDGDSASIAEYCVLISALTNIPLKQNLAVTGSINQHGDVQAIGGVNQKIEGFFDICKARGITGEQGVIIPQSNIKHLMLRHDVVDAAKNNQFHIYSVEKVEDALEFLSGMKAGQQDENGLFPEGTIGYQVIKRLDELQQLQKKYATPQKETGEEESEGNSDE